MAPKGSVSSSDSFTYWFDTMIHHLVCKKKCVDDFIGLAKTLLELFDYTVEFLTPTGIYIIVQNMKKFVLGRR